MSWIENIECPFVDVAFFAVVKVNDRNRQIHEQIHVRFEEISEQYRNVCVSSRSRSQIQQEHCENSKHGVICVVVIGDCTKYGNRNYF